MKKKKQNNKMSKQQITALKNTCRLAEETVNPIFGRMNKQGLSILLTLNSGYE